MVKNGLFLVNNRKKRLKIEILKVKRSKSRPNLPYRPIFFRNHYQSNNTTAQTPFRSHLSKVTRKTRTFHTHDTQTDHRFYTQTDYRFLNCKQKFYKIIQLIQVIAFHTITLFLEQRTTNNKVLFYLNIQRIYYNLSNEIYSINFIYTNKQEG